MGRGLAAGTTEGGSSWGQGRCLVSIPEAHGSQKKGQSLPSILPIYWLIKCLILFVNLTGPQDAQLSS